MWRALLDWILSVETKELEFEKHVYVTNELHQFVPLSRSIHISNEIMLKSIC